MKIDSFPHNVDTANNEYITWSLMVVLPRIKNCWNEFGVQPIVSSLYREMTTNRKMSNFKFIPLFVEYILKGGVKWKLCTNDVLGWMYIQKQ